MAGATLGLRFVSPSTEQGVGLKTRIGNLEKNIKPRKKLYKFPKIYVHILRFDNLSLNQLEIFKSKPS